MAGPLSNLFGGDGAGDEGATEVQVTSQDDGQSDTADGAQHQQSFQQNQDDGASEDAPAFAVNSDDNGAGNGALTDDYLESQ